MSIEAGLALLIVSPPSAVQRVRDGA